ncbi:MAG: hypothetical protein ACI9J3_000381 [Parvicellaceae bacterium]|jgi:hypothetical protein
MKHFYLAIMLFIPFTWSAQVGLVNNGDFESWTTINLSKNLNDFDISNQESPGVITCTQSTDAAHLTYSVLLETKEFAGDTVLGWIANGNLDALSGGQPHTANIDSVTVRVKYDIMPGDSATMILVQTGGIPTFNIWNFTGTQATWTTVNLPVTSALHDSIIFAAASGNAFADFSIDGSWLQIDWVELVNDAGANEDMPNNSFENWTDVDFEDPNGWVSFNAVAATLGFIPTPKTTNSFTGAFAAEMQISTFAGDTVNPVLTNGQMDVNYEVIGGVPYTSMPTNFEGAYQWNPINSIDSAFIFIEFRNSGSTIGGNILALGLSDATTGSYQTFSINTNLPSAPDTMTIIVYAEGTPGINLLIDALQLTGNGVEVDEVETVVYQVYPNPAQDVINVKGADSNTLIELFSLDGKLVAQNQGNSIQVQNLATGVYSMRINKGSMHKVMVK